MTGVVPSASDLAWPFEPSKGRSREEKLHSDRLRKCSAKTLKTLSSTINSLFKKPLSESEVSAIIAELTKRGIVVVNKTKISYALPVGS